ncbi:Ribosomal_L29_HIP superfamily protein [Babesia bovis T2Bo]|uniref:Large ribosomal subunit protein uL29 n=2 Tax=Babesia bovis TaxID=5865 RepID=RL35_BABBO|nr:Ribosomal_L29_HIP superfamily protein [Babesia bovis T2Bo]P52817.1 RecName: Full=Large ribosomal subunit protein uL29; AltName: Full=60S ribosomal protein L35 [Babesia bovis]AAC47013.1 ribosomal protein L35 [Babesia bovis]AAC48308.1 ribosomal protein L35 [Babesia bovis]AAN64581.1 ribosomal protein L35 [Babesia bovis]EDO07163.1 Ribosomal_L29_HIP superfamily protein [Babesia bovis T2Bo]BAN66206.1 ribosomal protein L35 [Babesia bovis]|eukprot:XP_001610731.1 ribosomal protein L35 [Babesia bovis T2Bo]
MEKIKVYELRNKTDAELLKQLEDLKQEYASMRVQKVTVTSTSKLSQIGVIRKAIAKVLTVYNQRKREEARKQYTKISEMPLNMRPKLTRAKRRALTPKQLHLKTIKQRKKCENFPKRKYALLV